MNRLKNLIKRLLGMDAPRLAFGSSEAKMMDLSRVSIIRSKDKAYLSNAGRVERELIPQLGLNDEKLQLFPKELHEYFGQGLLIWQYPNQFSKYLVQLSKFKIDSYMEIGVRHGGTFVTTVEYLNKFNPIKRAVAVDINDFPSAEPYAKLNPNSSFLKIDTTSEGFRKYMNDNPMFDLVLIDGDHSEQGCRNDFEAVKAHANMIACHDIEENAPGVSKNWSEFKSANQSDYNFFEFRDQYESVGKRWLGIGLAVRKNMPFN